MAKKETTSAAVFTKEQLLKSKRYRDYADYLMGNLDNTKSYTIEQVDKMIERFYGKGKGE